MKKYRDISFETLTTLKVGGGAREVYYPENENELLALSEEYARGDFLMVGGGSNILVSDRGFGGVVCIPSFARLSSEREGAHICFEVSSGCGWDDFVTEAVARGAWGSENLSSIPGTVGGAIVQNIGAYGAVLSESVVMVRAYDRKEKRVRVFEKDACAFGYRTSVFKTHTDRFVILSARFRLSATPKVNTSYRDIEERFGEGASPSLEQVRQAVKEIREKKFPDRARYGTAGSFFLNPIVREDAVEGIQKKFPSIPLFSLPEGGIKVPLAWILDHIVGARSFRVGKAFVWDKQPLVIATESGAKASEVRSLSEMIARAVYEKTNMRITPEVRFIFSSEKK